MDYYHIFSATMDPCNLDHLHFDYGQADWCSEPGCRTLLSCSGPITMRVQRKRLSRSPLNMVFGYKDVGLIRDDMLAAIPSEAREASLVVGPVLDQEGRPIHNWHCFYSRHRLIIRGSEDVGLRYCQGCGRAHYFALGHRHLCPPPPNGVSIFHAGNCSLVADTRTFFRLAPMIAGRLRSEKLPVFTGPQDGLGVEL